MITVYGGLARPRMEELLSRIPHLRVGVFGDVCLDAYWEADMTRSELSRETPHYPLPVVEERYSPGAGGNAAANLAALGCGEVLVCSAIGRDWRGALLKERLTALGVDASALLEAEDWTTPAYCKPIRTGLQQSRQEDARIDFQNYRSLPSEEEDKLLRLLDETAERCDAIAVLDQFRHGVVGAAARERLAHWAGQGKIIVADSRDRIGLFRGIVVKPNEIEAARWLEPDASAVDRSEEEWADIAARLSRHAGGPCCLTLGSRGAVWCEEDRAVFVPTREAPPPLDIVGAGDAFASALLCALAAGSAGPEAAAFAHLASAVVIRKIGMTGTASPDEVRAAFAANAENGA